jgi:probable rRNA maturation factor
MLKYDLYNDLNFPVNEKLIKKTAAVFGRLANLKKRNYFSLALVDGRTIRKWNKTYRGKDKMTDVLSFAQRESENVFVGDDRELGEILICFSIAKKQAKEYGSSLDFEVTRLLVHGLAHLAGYEHEDVSEKIEAKMKRFEEKVLNAILSK